MKKMIASALAVVSFSAVLIAEASIVEYRLHDVSFNDGGTATGTFSLDTTTGNPSTWDITTHPGSVITDTFEFTSATSHLFVLNPNPAGGLFNTGFEVTVNNQVSRQVQFFFNPTLTAPVAQSQVINANEIMWNAAHTISSVRVSQGGSVTAVPEPTNIEFLSVGVLIIAVLIYRRSS